MDEVKRYIETQILEKEFEAETKLYCKSMGTMVLYCKSMGTMVGYLCEQDVIRAIDSIKEEVFKEGVKYAMEKMAKL